MDFSSILDFLVVQFPIAGSILAILGSLVVILSGIDAILPEEKDGNFMEKVLNIPILGELLKQ